jgi:predicted TIM-barrel fold metal-dependent hydrolase
MYCMNIAMSKSRVDTHFHVFNAGQAVQGARYVPAYSASLSDWTRQAQSAGVGRGVWVQPSFLGTDNSLMVHALKAHPALLRGIAVVHADVQADALKALHEAGVRGIRLNLAGISHAIPEWSQASTVWDVLQALHWHVEVHTDQGALPEVLAQLPADIPLVVDHMAKPLNARADDPSVVALFRRAQQTKVHVKLSGAYRLGEVKATDLAQVLLHELGPEALLWGSDWPCTNHEQFADYGQLMAQAQTWMPAHLMDQILVSNPSKLYWGEDELSRDGSRNSSTER